MNGSIQGDVQLLTRECAWCNRVVLLCAGELSVQSSHVDRVTDDQAGASVNNARKPANGGHIVYVDDIKFGLPKGLQRMSCLVSKLCWSEASAETTYRYRDVHVGELAGKVVRVNCTDGELSTGSIEFECKHR